MKYPQFQRSAGATAPATDSRRRSPPSFRPPRSWSCSYTSGTGGGFRLPSHSAAGSRTAGLVSGLRRDGIWSDLPKLKRWLADDLTRERNAYARHVMTDIKTRKRAAAR